MKAIELFNKNMERCNSLIELHRAAIPKGRQVAHGEPADILRAGVVLCVAALDSYFRKRTVEVVENNVNSHQKVSQKCADIIASQFPKETRNYNLLSFLASQKPHKELAKLVKRSIAQSTFQNPEELTRALDIMGIDKPWVKINRMMSRGRGRGRRGRFYDCRRFIRDFVKRRNDIVHESDMYLSKRSHSKLKPITRSFVQKAINKMENFIELVEQVTRNN